MSSDAQRGTDAGDCASVRIVGTDIALPSLGCNTTATNCVIQAGGFSTVNTQAFGPNVISVRLGRLAGMYCWYAFRKIEFTFLPLVGPADPGSTTSQSAAALAAVAVTQNSQAELSDFPTTFQQVAEIDPSVVFTAWEGGSVCYRFNGTRLWSTSTGNSSLLLDQTDQLAISGRWFNTPPTTTPLKTHAIHVSFVLDLYRPQEPSAYPSLSELRGLPSETRAKLRELLDRSDEPDEKSTDPPPLIRHIQSEEMGSDGFYRVASPVRREPARPQRRPSPSPSVKK